LKSKFFYANVLVPIAMGTLFSFGVCTLPFLSFAFDVEPLLIPYITIGLALLVLEALLDYPPI
jgi:hypothetical protein